VQVSGTDLSDYTFLREDKTSSDLKWVVKGSGDKRRPAHQDTSTPAGFQDNAHPGKTSRQNLLYEPSSYSE
jgi:hypothetical protein